MEYELNFIIENMGRICQIKYMQKLCLCGCGLPAPIAKYSWYKYGWIKGQPKKYRRGHNKPHNKPHSEEAKKKISDKQNEWKKTEKYKEFVKKQRERAIKSKSGFRKGHKPFTDGKNLLGLQVGEKHWNWKGGITSEATRLRGTIKYINWRKAIFERDNYTCQMCKKRGVYLEADHYPIPFTKLFRDQNFNLMWDINNGRTLCRKCHDTTKKDWRKYV